MHSQFAVAAAEQEARRELWESVPRPLEHEPNEFASRVARFWRRVRRHLPHSITDLNRIAADLGDPGLLVSQRFENGLAELHHEQNRLLGPVSGIVRKLFDGCHGGDGFKTSECYSTGPR